ncbi:MAG TPA: hypothetical protein VMS93_12775 [Candidatus Saccharimonadales bacterium]|nr:hypothetical protein [Candidatus Saccharimonadales bacterium]
MLLAALLALLTLAQPAHPAPTPPEPTSEEDSGPELSLAAVRLGGAVLTDALACYQTPEGLLVPLGALSGLLDLAIEVDTARGRADGFFIREGRHFTLDMRARSVRVEDHERPYDASRVRRMGGDIYVEAGLLASWLPLDLTFDSYAAVLWVQPREPLPMQLRWERQRLIAHNLSQLGAHAASAPVIPTPYGPWDVPFIDQTLSFSLAPKSDGGRRVWLQHTAYVTMDLLYTEAGARFTGETRDGSSEFHAHAARKDPDAGLLGWLHAREIAGGEVAYPGLDLVARPASGNGFVLSSFPLTQPSQFDQHTFRGNLPPGWEVELYRNGAILAYQQASPEGTYTFENVPLLFGWNSFQRVFYGPQGQRRVETDVFNVGADLTPPRQSYYQAVVSGLGTRDERSLLEWNYGLTRRVSTTVSLASARLEDATRRYGNLGVQVLCGNLLGSADVANDLGHGLVTKAGVQTRVGQLGILLRHVQADGFRSEELNTQTRTREITTLRFDAMIRPPALPAFPMVLEMSRDRIDGSRVVEQVAGRVSCSRHGLSISDFTTWTRTTDPGSAQQKRTEGTLLLSRQLRHFALRGELDYEFEGSQSRNAMSVTAEVPTGEASQLAAGLNREMASGQLRYLLGYQKTGGGLGVGLQTSYTPGVGLAGNLSFTVGLNRDPRTRTWQMHARSVAGAGAASARVFLDSNGNGVMDPGEPPIGGVSLLLDDSFSPAQTGRDGVAFISNMPSDRGVDLSVVPATLEDPQWILERPAAQLVPRAGKVSMVDFPVLLSGEAAGTVRVRSAQGRKPAEGIQLELVDPPTGEVVRHTRSDYDGFYNFDELKPGRYVVRLVGVQLARLGLALPPERQVDIGRSGDVLDGLDFLLEPQSSVRTIAATAGAAPSPATPAPPAPAESLAEIPGPVAAALSALPAPRLGRAHARAALLAGPALPARPSDSGTRIAVRRPQPQRTLAGIRVLPSPPPPSDTLTVRAPRGRRPSWIEPLRVIWRAILRAFGFHK